MGGGGGGSGPTVQQQQLETQQALTNANLNLEENSQRKSILNSMMGTRVFRGSALSRALTGNTPGTGGEQAAPAPSASQTASDQGPIASLAEQASLATSRSGASSGSGATPAGGTGGSLAAQAAAAVGGYRGGARG